MSQAQYYLVTILTSLLVLIATNKPSSNWRYWSVVIFCFTTGLGVVALLSVSQPNENLLYKLIVLDFLSNRTESANTAVAFLVGLSLGFGIRYAWIHEWSRLIVSAAYAGILILGGLLVSKDVISPYLSDPNASVSSGLIASEVASGWSARDAFSVGVAPTAICLGDGKGLYVAGYLGVNNQTGAVAKIDLITKRSRLAAIGLTRPHGIAYWDGKAYVSRAGQYMQAVDGVITQVNTGAVTELADLDGDGIFDYFDDVIAGLPGAKLPDGLHQNNAIAFSSNGDLYVTVGNCSNRSAPSEKWEGTILRLGKGETEPEVFAKGFRNPYGLTISDNEIVFCTDNDPNEKNPGDKVIQVQPNLHHGHPYDSAEGIILEGVVQPLLRLTSAQGIASIPTEHQQAFGGDLLIASYGDDTITVVNSKTGSTQFFATVPTVVDICVDKDANVYACSYEEQKVYKFARSKE